MSVRLIASAVTTADALAAVNRLVAQHEARYGFSTDLQRTAAPMLARAAVLANRRGVSPADLRGLLWQDDGLTALIDDAVASPDDEESRLPCGSSHSSRIMVWRRARSAT